MSGQTIRMIDNHKQTKERNNIKNFIKRYISAKYRENVNQSCRLALKKKIETLDHNPSDDQILYLLKLTIKNKLRDHDSIIKKSVIRYRIDNPDDVILGYSMYQTSLESFQRILNDMSDMQIIYNDWKHMNKLRNVVQQTLTDFRCFNAKSKNSATWP